MQAQLYSPLQQVCKEIRFLRILPGSLEDEVQCILEVASLQDDPQYYALSYTWGDPKDTRQIMVNGAARDVTRNLESALRHLRSLETSLIDLDNVPIWIDALCINQDDVSERNQQVSIMDEIYSKTARVIIWLGEGDEVSDYVFQSMNSPDFCQFLDRCSDRTLDSSPEIAQDPHFVRAVTTFLAFPDLLKSPWWIRVWIVQEFVLPASEPLFVCGRASATLTQFASAQDLRVLRNFADATWLTWNEYDHALPGIEQLSQGLSSEGRTFRPSLLWSVLRGLRDIAQCGVNEKRYVPLASILGFYGLERSATDPRDHIYAYLGLIPPEERLLFLVDYASPPFQVYHKAMVFLWSEQARSTEHCIERFSFSRPRNEFPSWVPDLARQNSLVVGNWPKPRESQRWRRGEEVRFSSDFTVLEIRGLMLDVVENVYPFNEVQDSDSQTPNFARIGEFWRAYSIASAALDVKHPGSPLEDFRARSDVIDILTYTETETSGESRAQFDALVSLGADAIRTMSSDDNRFTLSEYLYENGLATGGPSSGGTWNDAMGTKFHVALERLKATLFGRNLVVTEKGLVGVSGQGTTRRDVLVFFFGMALPWILRPEGKVEGAGEYFMIIGPAYIGAMGEFELLDRLLDTTTLSERGFLIK